MYVKAVRCIDRDCNLLQKKKKKDRYGVHYCIKLQFLRAAVRSKMQLENVL